MFDLRARLQLDVGNFHRNMNRAREMTERAERGTRSLTRSNDNVSRSMSRVERSANSAGRAAERMTRNVGGGSGGFTSTIRGLGGLATAIGGVALAMGGVQAAKGLFDSTVGSAMRYERSEGLVNAMFGDAEKARKFMEQTDAQAIASATLDSGQMMAAAPTFIPMSQDLDELKQMYSIAEKLSILNPMQGMDGASFAMQELIAGKSTMSLKGRYSLSPKELDKIKNGSVGEILDGLDAILARKKITDETVTAMGKDSMAKFAAVQERTSKMLREVGKPSLDVVSGFLENIIDKFDSGKLDKFAAIGAKWIKSILKGLTNSAIGIFDWFSALTASQEFKDKTSIYGKVKFVFSDIYKNFGEWLGNGGDKQISSVVNSMLQVLSATFDSSAEAIATLSGKVGKAVWDGLSAGFKAHVDESMILSTIRNMMPKGFQMPGEWRKDIEKEKKAGGKGPWGAFLGFNAGTDRIKEDGIFKLHKGEAVLTSKKAADYRNGGAVQSGAPTQMAPYAGRAQGGGSAHPITIAIAKLADSIIVREDADIDKIAEGLVRKIIAAGEAGA